MVSGGSRITLLAQFDAPRDGSGVWRLEVSGGSLVLASAPIDPNALASSAQANLQNAASAAQAQLGKAASLTGESLENAGRKLQQWSAQSSASSTSAAASSSGSGYGGDAQKQMDK